MSVVASKIKPAIGVEITGLSGHEFVGPRAAEKCEAALKEGGVVVFPEANIDDDDLVALSRMLGDVVVAPTGEHEYPEIQTITLDPAKTNPILVNYRRGNFLWHIDGAHDAAPQKGTLLTAREVDDEGGDTEFASTFAAYDALPEKEKDEIADLRVVHSFEAARFLANPTAPKEEKETWARTATSVHPLVWTHRDGRKSLLIGATAALVIGKTVSQGRELLDRLLEWCTQPEFVLRHHWHPGDLVIWDNTGMLHRALPFESKSRRLMHRTTLVGEETVA